MIKRYCLLIFSLLLLTILHAQQLTQVSFSGVSTFSWFTVTTNQNVLLRISADGHLLEYGTEEQSLYNNGYFAPKLRPFGGATSTYTNDPDTVMNGKIKNIGTCYITYYGSKDYPEKVGKIKSVGILTFDYHRSYEDAAFAGKISSIGSSAIAWYTSSDNEAYKGKLKNVGNATISYYSSFDQATLKGKLKSIGSYSLPWNTVFAGTQLTSMLKTGNQRPLIDGVSYVLQ